MSLKRCKTCSGRGHLRKFRLSLVKTDGSDVKKCPTCNGLGKVDDGPATGVVDAVFLFNDGTIVQLRIPRRVAKSGVLVAKEVSFELHHIDEDGIFHFEQCQ